MISHHWINTTGLTRGIIKYYDFIRLITRTGIVMVLRNKFDAQAGLWVIADEEVLEKMVKVIKVTVQEVENKGNNKKLIKTVGIHGAEQRSKYKRAFLKTACDAMMTELDEIHRNLSEEEKKEKKEYMDLLVEYVQNTPSLKVLKPLTYYANNPK